MSLPDKFKFELVGVGFPVYFANKLNSTVYEVSWEENDQVKSCTYTVPSVESAIKTGSWKIIKEKEMNNIEQAMKVVEEAEKQLKAAKESLEKAKTNNIGLRIPVNFSTDVVYFRNLTGHYEEDSDSTFTKEGVLSCFASTNEAQAKAFAEALQVMAELRCQEGIVVPSKQCFTIQCNGGVVWLSKDFKYFNAQVISPAYISQEYAQKAIDNVGKERIIEAYKTMLFMTPESRGEI